MEPFSSKANLELLKRAGFKDTICIMKFLCFEDGLLSNEKDTLKNKYNSKLEVNEKKFLYPCLHLLQKVQNIGNPHLKEESLQKDTLEEYYYNCIKFLVYYIH